MASFELDDKTKLWSVRFRLIEHGKEKNKRLRGFATKKDANKAYIDFMASYVPTEKLEHNAGQLTLAEVFDLYLHNDVKFNLKGSTQYVMQHDFDRHIAPVLGNLKLEEIKKRNIIDWQNNLTAQDYAYAYKKKIKSFLSAIFKFAIQYLDYTENPVKNCPPFKKPQEHIEMNVWSLDEFNRFISVVDEPMYHATFMTLFYMGIRKGELQALTWKDIDLNAKKMSITKTLTRKTTKGTYEITPPKRPSSNRVISIPSQLIDELSQYKALCSTKDKFAFGGDKPIDEKALDRKLTKWCNIAGVKIIKPHEFRHSHASMLIYLKASIVLISKRLGHKSIDETLRTYAHLMNAEQDEVMNLLSNYQ